MDAVSLRGQLATFLSDRQYRKFVAGLRRTERLRFWQEQEWERFIAAHPSSRVSLDDLRVALRVCELHATELLPDNVAVVEGHADLAEWYVRARRAEFPNASAGPVYAEGAPLPGPTVDVWYCPGCRHAETRWWAGHGRSKTPSELDLTRRTTLDEVEAAWAHGSLDGRVRHRYRALWADVASSLAAGGELWEWETAGLREFAGVCGLAVVRDRCIIRHWILGKS